MVRRRRRIGRTRRRRLVFPRQGADNVVLLIIIFTIFMQGFPHVLTPQMCLPWLQNSIWMPQKYFAVKSRGISGNKFLELIP
jgi:hypothetical protein